MPSGACLHPLNRATALKCLQFHNSYDSFQSAELVGLGVWGIEALWSRNDQEQLLIPQTGYCPYRERSRVLVNSSVLHECFGLHSVNIG
jgi:hypothetical protein